MFLRRNLFSIICIIAGFFCGFITYGLALVHSSPYYLDSLRVNYRVNQKILSIKKTSYNDMVGMLVHRKNVVNSYSCENLPVFEENVSGLKFWSPFQLIALKNVTDTMVDLKSETISEGVERGKLAYTMDLLGLQNYSENEWEVASQMAGYCSEIEKFKNLITKLIETEMANFQQ